MRRRLPGEMDGKFIPGALRKSRCYTAICDSSVFPSLYGQMEMMAVQHGQALLVRVSLPFRKKG